MKNRVYAINARKLVGYVLNGLSLEDKASIGVAFRIYVTDYPRLEVLDDADVLSLFNRMESYINIDEDGTIRESIVKGKLRLGERIISGVSGDTVRDPGLVHMWLHNKLIAHVKKIHKIGTKHSNDQFERAFLKSCAKAAGPHRHLMDGWQMGLEVAIEEQRMRQADPQRV